jgi:uncharacterized protein (TIGR02118 family)
MVKLVVAYGPPEDPAAFDTHYSSNHRPLVDKIPNLRRFEAGKVLGTPDGTTSRTPTSCRRRWAAPRGRPPEPMWRPSPRAGRR